MSMRVLFAYLKKYRPLVITILVLASINQIFSLLDPVIFRHVIDDYATKYEQYTTSDRPRSGTALSMRDSSEPRGMWIAPGM